MLPAIVVSALLSAAPCLLAPVKAMVIDPFREPACTYCPGNRGIEYGPAAGGTALAAAPGVVSFAGSVAGTTYVVVEHTGGFRTTYGRLTSVAVKRGQLVAAGQMIGATGARFFFSVRVGDRYVDPAGMFARAVYRPFLVPLDGSHRRPPPPARFACG